MTPWSQSPSPTGSPHVRAFPTSPASSSSFHMATGSTSSLEVAASSFSPTAWPIPKTAAQREPAVMDGIWPRSGRRGREPTGSGNADQFNDINTRRAGQVLGLFETGHMEYEADRAADSAGEPSLAEMTETAIELLSRNRRGFVLTVEGGRIDHAHHEGNAARALGETVALLRCGTDGARHDRPGHVDRGHCRSWSYVDDQWIPRAGTCHPGYRRHRR